LVEAKHLLQIERYLEAHDRFKAAADLKLAHRSEAGRYMENVKTLISQKFEGQGRPDLPAFSHYEHSAGWPSVDEPEQNKAVDDIIRKTPHMDIGLESELQPGSTFDVSIFVDN